MSVESAPQTERVHAPEGERNPRFVMFIAGIFAGNKELEKMRTVFEERYGEGNFAVVSSVTNFKDKPTKKRFKSIAETLQKKIDEGQEVVLSGHSLAGPEIVAVLNNINPDYYNKLQVRPVAPVNFWGITGALKKYAHVVTEQGPLANKFKEAPERGVDTTLTVPVEGMSRRDVIDAERRVLRGRSQYRDGVRTVEGSSTTNYRDIISADPEELAQIDEQLADSARNGEDTVFRTALVRRGIVLHNDLESIYQGRYEGAVPEDGEYAPFALNDIPRVVGQTIHVASLLAFRRSFRKLRKLYEQGLNVKFINAEYDPCGSTHLMEKFYRNLPESEALDNNTIMEGTVHASFATQSHTLVDAINTSLS